MVALLSVFYIAKKPLRLRIKGSNGMLKHLPKQWKELAENLINRLESIKAVQCFVDSFVKQKLMCSEHIWHVVDYH